ncbi:MAG: hypothetical protein IH867_07395, partial [Chloroflexi bacterium]|nr:hypothetical protein [Chloroflexota bacterium]
MTTEQLSTDHQRAAELVESVNRSEMSRIVEQVLDEKCVEVTGNWTSSPVGKSIGTGTIGICVVRGAARLRGETKDWSMVAKVMDVDAEGLVAIASAGAEIETYSNGMLDTLTGKSAPDSKFRAAKFYGLTELQGDCLFILWLE